jgi:hypothetical protein
MSNADGSMSCPASVRRPHGRHVIAFRADPVLTSAVEVAAALDLCSLSDVARGAVARDLRRRGLLTDLVETERTAKAAADAVAAA